MSDDPDYIKFSTQSVEARILPSGMYDATVVLRGTIPSIAMKDKVFDKLMKEGVKVYPTEILQDQVVTLLKEDLAREKGRVVELESEVSFLKNDLTKLREELNYLHRLEEELGNLSRLRVN